MPFVSQAQRAKFYATPGLRKYIPEFEAATHSRLPKHKRKHKHRGHAIAKAAGGRQHGN